MTDRRFVFLEITQRGIGALLWHIQWIMTGVEPRQPVHLTVRGPYRRAIAPRVLEKCRETLGNDTLRIGDVGRFTNPDHEVVFLRVDSPNLRKIWWKPTYPIKDHGYTPHISLYRGNDASFADLVARFLERERLELKCNEHRLTVHPSGGLPFGTDRPEVLGQETWPTLLARLHRFVDAYRSASDASDPSAQVPSTHSARPSLSPPPKYTRRPTGNQTP